MTSRIAVLASGGGSNCQVLIDHFADAGRDVGSIVLVASNVADAGVLDRARRANIATAFLEDPANSTAVLATLRAARVDLVVLAGYLKLVPAEIVEAFRGRMLNVHPSLLPAFGGPGMHGQRVHAAVLAHGARLSGVTVHFVDEEFDRGAIVAQWPVSVHATDTPTELAARVLRAEHQLFPRAVAAVASGAVSLSADGRVVGEVPLPDLPLIS